MRILRAGDESALKRFLVPRLDSSLFLYGNMLAAGLNDTGERYAGTYAAAFENGRMVAVAGHFWNQTMVLQAPVHLKALMAQAQDASGRPLKRLVGPNDQVVEAIDLLGLTAADLQMDEKENLYSLPLADLSVPDLLTSGEAVGRRIQVGDLELVSQWRTNYLRELHLEEDSPELHEIARRHVRGEIAAGRTWILEVQGKPVASTSLNATVRDEGVAGVVQVGGVYTPPELRGRGYGRSAVAASLIDARSEGYQRSVLFTGISNLAAQRAYLALGYRLIGAYRITVLREAK
ncbi:MAG: GNAT family N-acetyltransferase [Chloroflexota bacterium]|nr:MAG: GNAT family N-acetyltransferase [Chloroflexota bacterium]